MMKNEIKDRILWMDLLNITAILGVIMMHTNDAQNHFNGILTSEYIWACAVAHTPLKPMTVASMLFFRFILISDFVSFMSLRS